MAIIGIRPEWEKQKWFNHLSKLIKKISFINGIITDGSVDTVFCNEFICNVDNLKYILKMSKLNIDIYTIRINEYFIGKSFDTKYDMSIKTLKYHVGLLYNYYLKNKRSKKMTNLERFLNLKQKSSTNISFDELKELTKLTKMLEENKEKGNLEYSADALRLLSIHDNNLIDEDASNLRVIKCPHCDGDLGIEAL